MRSLLFSLLFVAGCSDSLVPSKPAHLTTRAYSHASAPQPQAIAASPFLPAIAAAGLLAPNHGVVLNAVDLCGSIVVERVPYLVLYLDRHIEIGPGNRRDVSHWLICDTSLNPVWINRDYGGRPGKCFDNKVVVAMNDKTFEIDDDQTAVGDLLTFSTTGHGLCATLSWSSDTVRIASALNAEKWRTDSHEPDEEITEVHRVPGRPTWRLVLTRYVLPCHQGCAKLVALTSPDECEFGVRELGVVFSRQACRPTQAHLRRLPVSRAVLVVVNWETRGGHEYQDTCILIDENTVELQQGRHG